MQKLGHLIQTTRGHVHINTLSVTENAAGINSKAPREANPPSSAHSSRRVPQPFCTLLPKEIHFLKKV